MWANYNLIMGQPTSDTQVIAQEANIKIHTIIGELLALGLTNEEILEKLQEGGVLSEEEAKTALRTVYDCWTSVREGLNLQSPDDRNWHQYLRMKLLQRVMPSEAVASQRLVLQILDSLADIQGISTTVVQEIPLQINLVEKEKEPEPTGDQTNDRKM